MSANKESYDQLLVIFGASGDLTSRKLLPAFSELFSRGLLPDRFAILGAARSDFSDISFRRSRRQVLKGDRADEFLGKVYYLRFDPADPRAYPKLAKRIVRLRGELRLPDRILYYLATPPSMYPVIAQGLLESGLNVPEGEGGWRRIIVEKPFGSDLETARRLNGLLRGIFAEREIYRIDHYLGKETVQNILVLRFSNGIFEPLWNRNYIDRVEIRATETLGVGNRGKYYDGAGAMRDMVQNHLMQLMAFAAMEAPAVFEPEPMRDEIVKVFRSLRPYTAQRMDRDIVRAQYRGYREEKDVSPDSTTETFVAMKFYIDNWRWGGVPFLLYTGKKLDRKESEIVIRFKSTPQRLFAGQCSGSSCNKLTIRIQPDESVSLGFGLKMPGAGFRVKQVSMDFRYDSLSHNYLPDAYERLLLDAILGDSTLYARSDALEASWKIIDPVLRHWAEHPSRGLRFYTPGSQGPEEALALEKYATMNIHSYSVAHEAIEALTRRMADRMLGSAGSFHVALSGGETAKRLFPFWSGPFADRLDWDRIRFYWVDERCVPPDDPQSNFGTAERLLFSPLTVPASHVHRIRGEQPPETEAERYTHLIGQELSGPDGIPRFDCVVLGVGEDMHTASIFSETSFLLTAEPGYRVSIHPRSAQMRITMTGSLILAARLLLVPMLGERKLATARHLAEKQNDRSPAGYLLSRAEQAELFVGA